MNISIEKSKEYFANNFVYFVVCEFYLVKIWFRIGRNKFTIAFERNQKE